MIFFYKRYAAKTNLSHVNKICSTARAGRRTCSSIYVRKKICEVCVYRWPPQCKCAIDGASRLGPNEDESRLICYFPLTPRSLRPTTILYAPITSLVRYDMLYASTAAAAQGRPVSPPPKRLSFVSNVYTTQVVHPNITYVLFLNITWFFFFFFRTSLKWKSHEDSTC